MLITWIFLLLVKQMENEYLIIVAGGIGSRMNSELPKQFIELNGEPIIIKTIKQFLNYNPNITIIISIHKDYEMYLKELLKNHFHENNFLSVKGGATRFQSVKNALNTIKNASGTVAIHDAARPFVSKETIAKCFETAKKLGNAIPVVDVTESLRQIINQTNKSVDRTTFKVVQTPQCFNINIIQKAFDLPENPLFTDDASVLEALGYEINLVKGNFDNIKITTPKDL
jgi:2-C-methyl-D-erythritol 4-phosphate cytidylyltransferase